jgi:hypothetical protein
VEHTLGLWGTPEPSFNAHVTGKVRDVLAFARSWGKDYNQQAMAMLLPTQKGPGGILNWDFGRRLTVGELERLLGGLMWVNEKLMKLDKPVIGFIGLTVKDQQMVEFWVKNDLHKIVGLFHEPHVQGFFATVVLHRRCKKPRQKPLPKLVRLGHQSLPCAGRFFRP